MEDNHIYEMIPHDEIDLLVAQRSSKDLVPFLFVYYAVFHSVPSEIIVYESKSFKDCDLSKFDKHLVVPMVLLSDGDIQTKFVEHPNQPTPSHHGNDLLFNELMSLIIKEWKELMDNHMYGEAFNKSFHELWSLGQVFNPSDRERFNKVFETLNYPFMFDKYEHLDVPQIDYRTAFIGRFLLTTIATAQQKMKIKKIKNMSGVGIFVADKFTEIQTKVMAILRDCFDGKEFDQEKINQAINADASLKKVQSKFGSYMKFIQKSTISFGSFILDETPFFNQLELLEANRDLILSQLNGIKVLEIFHEKTDSPLWDKISAMNASVFLTTSSVN